MLYRVSATALIVAQLFVAGCGHSSRVAPASHEASPQAALRSTHVLIVTCEDSDCSNCNPAFQACEYCDPSDLDCPPVIVIGGPTGGGSGPPPPPSGPACAQSVDGPDGTFDHVHTNVTYTVPYAALTKWTMLSANHVDQVNVEFYDGGTYAGANAQGGTSVAMTGLYTSNPPLYSTFTSTRMTGNWIDKNPSHQTPDGNLTFTATADSSC